MEVRKDGAWRTITTAEAYIGGSWRPLKYGEAYISGAWREIASFIQTLTLSVATPVHTVGSTSPVTSGTSATPTGGLGPFTYAWTIQSQSGLNGLTIGSPSSASTSVTATVVGGSGSFGTTTLRCTVTDSRGSTAHADAALTLTEFSGPGGGTE